MNGENLTQVQSIQAPRDDRLLLGTRLLALFVIPFLIAASVILYLFAAQTARLFAWPVKPAMTAMLLGSAYMGGIYFFARVALAQRWHTVKAGFLPITAFTGLLSIATLLHWDRFSHDHIAFFTWTALYFTTPFLAFAAWLVNRRLDPQVPEPGELLLPSGVRGLLAITGGITLLIGLLLFTQPGGMITVWPWDMTPLTARVVGTLFVLPGVLALEIATDRRWSAARVVLEAQALSIIMILIAAVLARDNFHPANQVSWIFILGLAGLLAGIIILYTFMQFRPAPPLS